MAGSLDKGGQLSLVVEPDVTERIFLYQELTSTDSNPSGGSLIIRTGVIIPR